MATPRELYAREPQREHKDLSFLVGCYYTHIPEVPLSWGETVEGNERVTLKELRYFDYDGRRFWLLCTVWLDDKPVMIIQNAGREGDDHARRFITDYDAYTEMVRYIASLIKVDIEEGTDKVDLDEDDPDLTRFYGDTLDGAFERYHY